MSLPFRNSGQAQPSPVNLATWIAKVEALSPKQHKDFIIHSRADLDAYIREFEVIAEKSKTRKTLKFVKPIFELSKVLGRVATNNPVLHGLDPTHSMLLVGGVASVFSSLTRFRDSDEKVTKRFENMLEHLGSLEKYDTLYLTQVDVQRIAVLLCEDILDFCVAVSSRFSDKKNVLKSGLRRFKESLFNPSERLSDAEKNFDGHLIDFNKVIAFAQAENIGKVSKLQDRMIIGEFDRFLLTVSCFL
jgi:hypothetical protein